ncbi:hypothetical protein FA15DRAFT_249649 [Coprinopsis marcescibilis]|uniref:Uncharacterized protein n=1 Tax=Coprinopsis marcescibilis TaxID=230819 RepID=A0A5C3KS43_COPMA|nr:hypothetical protein FA15DRAFT_249649 [Coprinopsis marcescibilis]
MNYAASIQSESSKNSEVETTDTPTSIEDLFPLQDLNLDACLMALAIAMKEHNAIVSDNVDKLERICTDFQRNTAHIAPIPPVDQPDQGLLAKVAPKWMSSLRAQWAASDEPQRRPSR